MIDILTQHQGSDAEMIQELTQHVAAVRASAGLGDRTQVAKMEATVRANPGKCFDFGADGSATLRTVSAAYPAGRFEVCSLRELRTRVPSNAESQNRRVRLWVLDGVSPATDIGSLQATAGPNTLFQVASQFNCLESPGPYVTSVGNYFHDPTQGPRASISAFTGTLLRHYAAPGPDGQRMVQTNNGPQINLLAAVCSPDVAQIRNGYLTSDDIIDAEQLAAALVERFDDIQMGVHDDVSVLLGYNWDGAVTGTPHIGQVFTSTFAGGGYSRVDMSEPAYQAICTQLLRAAYLGTLLAAAALSRHRVVLTLIGGGAFGIPIPLIWECILWAIRTVEALAAPPMDVIVNGRNLGDHVPPSQYLPQVRERGSAAVVFAEDRVLIHR